MRRKHGIQEQADALLTEWASGIEAARGMGYPSHEHSTPVQGRRARLTSPERYAHRHHRWDRLDRSVRHVHRMNRDLGVALWDRYGHGYLDLDCARRAAFVLPEMTDAQRAEGVQAWYSRLATARVAFLSAYTMACAPREEKPQDGVDEAVVVWQGGH